MWTFRRRYMFLVTGLLIGLAILYFGRDHQPVVPTHQKVKGHHLPIKDIIPVIPLRDDTYKLINEADIKHTELIDESLQHRGQQIDDDLKTIELSVAKDAEIDKQTISEIDYGVHDVQHNSDKDKTAINITKSAIAVQKHETNSITHIQKISNSTAKDGTPKQPIKIKDLVKADHDISVNTTHQKVNVFHIEQGSGGLDNGDGQPRVLDRSQGSASFWRRVDWYCNAPNQPVTGEEGHIPSGNYRLQSVSMVMRHGDRTPMSELKFPWLKWSPKWECDLKKASKKPHFSQLADLITSATVMTESGNGINPKVAMHLQHLPIGANSKLCFRAQMTPQGWMQQVLLGQHMRAAYTGSIFSSSTTWRDPNPPVHIQSTMNGRTQRSAFAFMFGLLPGLQHQDGARVKPAYSINFCRGLLCNCPAITPLNEMREKAQGKHQKENKMLKEVLQEITKILIPTDLPKKEEKKKHKLPGVSVLQEQFFAALCHNKSLPCVDDKCVTPDHFMKILNSMDNIANELRTSDDSPQIQYGRLYMHPFLTLVMQSMEAVTNNKSTKSPEFNLYSGHDVTIIPLIDALGLPRHQWSKYAARVVFELWTDKFLQNYVRILYDGEDQTKYVRFCRGKVNKDGLCPLTYFVSFVKQDSMQYFKADSFAEACQQMVAD